MLGYLAIIGLIVYLITLKIYKKKKIKFADEKRDVEVIDIISLISLIAFIVGSIFSIFFIIRILSWNEDLYALDTYKRQNKEIEETIKDTVETYMNYEQQTFISLKPEEAIQYVSLYPDLKSNTLVEKQIELYIRNNEQIKSLEVKKDKIEYYKKLIFYIPTKTRRV